MHPQPVRASWKFNIFLSFASIGVAFLLLEAGLRFFAPVGKPPAKSSSSLPAAEYWATYDPDIGYRLNPKFGDINSEGLRDHPVQPKNGRFRILFLGDSLGYYGDTVDDTFVGHFRSSLRQNPRYQSVDVLNACIKGYSNYQEILFLKKYGLPLEPDMVGVEFCLNDLHKFLHKFQVKDGKLVPESYQFTEEARNNNRSLARRLAYKSRLLVWLRDNLPIARRALVWQTSRGFSFDYNTDVGLAWQDGPWASIETQLLEFKQLGEQHHFPVFIALFPLGVQYDAGYLARNKEYVLKPQRKLKEICDRLSIPFYDLYPHLRADLFDKDGIHLTPEGRRSVGRRIADFVEQAHLIPEVRSGRLIERTPPLPGSPPPPAPAPLAE